MRIDVAVTGHRDSAQAILRVGVRARSPQRVLSSVADYLLAETQHRFDSEGRYGPGNWKRLKPATVAQKRRKGQDTRVLRRTGALAAALTTRGGANQIVQIDSQRLRIGTTLFYAKFHDRAASGGNLPRRRLMTFTRLARDNVVDTLERWIVHGSSR